MDLNTKRSQRSAIIDQERSNILPSHTCLVGFHTNDENRNRTYISVKIIEQISRIIVVLENTLTLKAYCLSLNNAISLIFQYMY